MSGTIEDQLAELAASTALSPLKFVLAAFPWGEPGGPLEGINGPDVWQRLVLEDIGSGVASRLRRARVAVAGANGVGKSAVMAWVVLWAMTTCPDTRVIVTAGTAGQLASKTWPELQRWHKMSLWQDQFIWTATTLYSADESRAQSWRANAIPWSADRPEAFAGLHNRGNRIVIVIDEASGVADPIWEAIAGSLTDDNTDLVLLVLGNPTRLSGKFFDAFNKDKHRFARHHVNAWNVKQTDKAQLEQWRLDHGETSSFYRVRALGLFPHSEESGFIGRDIVDAAMRRQIEPDRWSPLIMSCDIARQGSDETVIAFRRGRDARSIPWVVMREADLMQIAAKIADLANLHQVDGVLIDATGVGAGVYDRVMQLRLPNVRSVQFGGADDWPAVELGRAAQKRTAMWMRMREWLRVGAIPDDNDLATELCAPMFAHNVRDEVQLERKESMRARGFSSLDRADALATGFAYEVAPRARSAPRIINDYEPDY